MKRPESLGQPGTVDGIARRMAFAYRITLKDARAMLAAVFALIRSDVRETKRLVIPGFGTFHVRQRKSKRVVDPNGAEHVTAPREALTFTEWRAR